MRQVSILIAEMNIRIQFMKMLIKLPNNRIVDLLRRFERMNFIFRRKRTSENQCSTSTIRFEHATNKTSPYFFQRTDNKLKRNISNGESRTSPLANIHSKPLNNRTRLWDDDDDDDEENSVYNWHSSTKKIDQQFSTDISLSKAVTTTMNIRKKG